MTDVVLTKKQPVTNEQLDERLKLMEEGIN
jgi:hypothetical protein